MIKGFRYDEIQKFIQEMEDEYNIKQENKLKKQKQKEIDYCFNQLTSIKKYKHLRSEK